MENELKKILASVLEIDIETIDAETSEETVENWDSLKQMNIIAALEEQFNIEFDDEETVLLNSYELFLESLRDKLGQ